MRHNYSLEYQKVALCPLAEEDSEKLRILRNQSSSKFIDASYISREAQSSWYHNYLDKANDYMFSVRLRRGNGWIGAAGIYNIDPMEKVGEFGRIVIDRQAAGEGGFGVVTTKAVCLIAFTQLHLNKLKLEVYYDNIPALITYLKAGFLPVGMAESGHKRLVKMEFARSEEGSYEP